MILETKPAGPLSNEAALSRGPLILRRQPQSNAEAALAETQGPVGPSRWSLQASSDLSPLGREREARLHAAELDGSEGMGEMRFVKPLLNSTPGSPGQAGQRPGSLILGSWILDTFARFSATHHLPVCPRSPCRPEPRDCRRALPRLGGATGPAQARPGGGQRALFWAIDTRGCLAPRAQPRRETARLGRPRGF